MLTMPDLTDARYLNEVGWFLYREKYGANYFGHSYAEERVAYSRMLLDEVLRYCGQDSKWLDGKTVVSVGCGCSGDLAVWPAAIKIAVDPLLYMYQKLGMLLEDAPGTAKTVFLSVGGEDLPLLDECADLAVCRNSLDHMLDPAHGLNQIRRILKPDGALFLSVDVGGQPTPDEPSVFSMPSLTSLLREHFDVSSLTEGHPPHDEWRPFSVRALARKKPAPGVSLDRDAVLRAYEASIGQPAR
jgi:SAM-dependent methyltransferase